MTLYSVMNRAHVHAQSVSAAEKHPSSYRHLVMSQQYFFLLPYVCKMCPAVCRMARPQLATVRVHFLLSLLRAVQFLCNRMHFETRAHDTARNTAFCIAYILIGGINFEQKHMFSTACDCNLFSSRASNIAHNSPHNTRR